MIYYMDKLKCTMCGLCGIETLFSLKYKYVVPPVL